MRIINSIIRLIKGNYRVAIENGLVVGKGVSIVGERRGCDFGSEPYLITLGDYCRVSNGVMFITHDGGTWAFRDLPEYHDVIKYGKISIGDHTFIGARSIIMPGVKIGCRCVIGAGSVVTKSVPDGTVVAGVPAKPIMTTEQYAEKILSSQVAYDKSAYNSDKREFLKEWLK